MEIQSVLKEKFGHNQFRTGQEAVIHDVVAKKNTIAILPTGSGKSLCYQLPAYMMDGTVLIVSPLIALMEDQVAIMKRNGEKRVVAINSFLSYHDRTQIMTQLASYKFIFISPEMLMQSTISSILKGISIAFVVVDEAHCISQWGFDFRPDYLRIGEFLVELGRPKVLALTATADQEVLKDVIHYLNLDNPVTHKHSLDRQNISYEILPMDSEQAKTEWIVDRMENTTGPGIIYVASRKRADSLAHLLNDKLGLTASYHGGMEQEDRAFIQEQFINGDINWICATNAFGMGIHKDDVRQVIHEHMPATIAGYTQEVGRAGRDGELSAATLLYTGEDIRKTRFITQEDAPREEEIRYFAQLITSKMPSEEAARLSGISETGRRVIEYYFERLSVEETVIRIAKQSEEKERQLQRMLHVIQSEKCVRQEVLGFFGETLTTQPESCCSNCGIAYNDWLYRIYQESAERSLVDWKERISQLLD